MRILYAEKSLRPMPTELTYVARAPLREYDYYIIAEVEGRPIPLLIEELSDAKEFGAKTAIDKLAGISIPVLFAVKCWNSVQGLENIEGWYTGDISPSLSAWSLPAVYHAPNLVEEAERISEYSIYPQIVVRDFWEELAEASLTYAPSIYYRYIVKQLIPILRRFLSRGDKSNIRLLAWKSLLWRLICEQDSFIGTCSCKSEQSFKPKLGIREYVDRHQSLVDIDHEICKCGEILALIVLPPLREAIESVKRHGLKLYPPLATLVMPVIQLIEYMDHACSSAKDCKVAIAFVHDASSPEEQDQIKYLLEYTVNILNLVSDSSGENSQGVKVLKDHEYVDRGWKIHKLVMERITKKLTVSIVALSRLENNRVKMLRELSKGEINTMLELATQYNEVEAPCILLVARDAPKTFYLSLLDEVEKKWRNVYYTYAPEVTPMYTIPILECAKSCCFRKNKAKVVEALQKLSNMPTRGILLYLYGLINDGNAPNVCFGGKNNNYIKRIISEASRNSCLFKCLIGASFFSIIKVSKGDEHETV